MMAWLARLAASEALVARNCRHLSKPSAARWVTMTCGSYVWPSGTGFSSVRQSWQTAQTSISATTSPKARHRASVSAPSASSVQAHSWADSMRNNAVPPTMIGAVTRDTPLPNRPRLPLNPRHRRINTNPIRRRLGPNSPDRRKRLRMIQSPNPNHHQMRRSLGPAEQMRPANRAEPPMHHRPAIGHADIVLHFPLNGHRRRGENRIHRPITRTNILADPAQTRPPRNPLGRDGKRYSTTKTTSGRHGSLRLVRPQNNAMTARLCPDHHSA
jgi:hypothetical protein